MNNENQQTPDRQKANAHYGRMVEELNAGDAQAVPANSPAVVDAVGYIVAGIIRAFMAANRSFMVSGSPWRTYTLTSGVGKMMQIKQERGYVVIFAYLGADDSRAYKCPARADGKTPFSETYAAINWAGTYFGVIKD